MKLNFSDNKFNIFKKPNFHIEKSKQLTSTNKKGKRIFNLNDDIKHIYNANLNNMNSFYPEIKTIENSNYKYKEDVENNRKIINLSKIIDNNRNMSNMSKIIDNNRNMSKTSTIKNNSFRKTNLSFNQINVEAKQRSPKEVVNLTKNQTINTDGVEKTYYAAGTNTQPRTTNYFYIKDLNIKQNEVSYNNSRENKVDKLGVTGSKLTNINSNNKYLKKRNYSNDYQNLNQTKNMNNTKYNNLLLDCDTNEKQRKSRPQTQFSPICGVKTSPSYRNPLFYKTTENLNYKFLEENPLFTTKSTAKENQAKIEKLIFAKPKTNTITEESQYISLIRKPNHKSNDIIELECLINKKDFGTTNYGKIDKEIQVQIIKEKILSEIEKELQDEIHTTQIINHPSDKNFPLQNYLFLKLDTYALNQVANEKVYNNNNHYQSFAKKIKYYNDHNQLIINSKINGTRPKIKNSEFIYVDTLDVKSYAPLIYSKEKKSLGKTQMRRKKIEIDINNEDLNSSEEKGMISIENADTLIQNPSSNIDLELLTPNKEHFLSTANIIELTEEIMNRNPNKFIMDNIEISKQMEIKQTNNHEKHHRLEDLQKHNRLEDLQIKNEDTIKTIQKESLESKKFRQIKPCQPGSIINKDKKINNSPSSKTKKLIEEKKKKIRKESSSQLLLLQYNSSPWEN